MTTLTRRTKLVCGITAGGVLGVATLAGCGSSSSTNSAATSAAATTTSAAASSSTAGTWRTRQAAYRQCLEQNGVTFPSKGAHASGQATSSGEASPSGHGMGHGHHKMGPPAGVSQDVWNKAVAACASLKPTKAAKPSS